MTLTRSDLGEMASSALLAGGGTPSKPTASSFSGIWPAARPIRERDALGGRVHPRSVATLVRAGQLGGGAGGVVVESCIETGQVQFVVDEVIQCVFEGAGE